MQPDSLVVLKKPFDNVEVQQLAHTLARKWELNFQAAMGIQQLDNNIRMLLASSANVNGAEPATMETTSLHPDFRSQLMGSSDGQQFVTSLKRLSEAVETTRKQLRHAEQQLVQAEKMASLGRLSAGIIHEINNPMNYAMAALSMLESGARHLPEHLRDDHVDALKDMRDGFSRMSEITGSLRKFAHPESGDLVEVRLNDTISTALRLMSAEIKDEIVIDNRIPADLTVWAAGSKLTQVFMNLIHNSAYALRLKKFDSGIAPRISFDATVEGEQTIVTVSDNGTGIPAAELGKIFDPFYTTKGIGEGTGLGLGICHQIMKQFGATITALSQEGAFAKFRLTFPEQVF